MRFLYGLLSFFLLNLVSASGAAQPPLHNEDFWLQIVKKEGAIPKGENAGKLAFELADLLSSPDPVLRDTAAYSLLAQWIYQDQLLDSNELEQLRQKLQNNLTTSLGESGTDNVFQRSFSALVLSILAASDLKKPFLSEAAFQSLLGATLDYLRQENDLRAYDPVKGWIHATAHAADLLKFLGRNPKLQKPQQALILQGIVNRLKSAHLVFVWGEEGRLANALASLTAREDFDPSPFHKWFADLITENQKLWSGTIQSYQYIPVRVQADCLTNLHSKLTRDRKNPQATGFLECLSKTLEQIGE
jgi:hypothetical protein